MTETELKEPERKYFGSRTPQVLIIQDYNILTKKAPVIQIIKSRMKNTRIHAPREYYEQYINMNSIDKLKITDSEYYEKKYIKYKTKYINLCKVKLNNYNSK